MVVVAVRDGLWWRLVGGGVGRLMGGGVGRLVGGGGGVGTQRLAAEAGGHS